MKVFKYNAPYKANGSTNFPESKNKSGVYLIKENGIVVYVGHSKINLYRTLYRHFQHWNHPGQPVVSYSDRKKSNYTVRIVYCTPLQAMKLERALILKLQPRDNIEKYKGYQMTFGDNYALKSYASSEVINTCPF